MKFYLGLLKIQLVNVKTEILIIKTYAKFVQKSRWIRMLKNSRGKNRREVFNGKLDEIGFDNQTPRSLDKLTERNTTRTILSDITSLLRNYQNRHEKLSASLMV